MKSIARHEIDCATWYRLRDMESIARHGIDCATWNRLRDMESIARHRGLAKLGCRMVRGLRWLRSRRKGHVRAHVRGAGAGAIGIDSRGPKPTGERMDPSRQQNDSFPSAAPSVAPAVACQSESDCVQPRAACGRAPASSVMQRLHDQPSCGRAPAPSVRKPSVGVQPSCGRAPA